MIVDKKTFFEVQVKLDNIPFSQTQEWLLSNYFNLEESLLYYIDSIDNPSIGCFGVISSKKIIGNKMIIDGISCNNGLTYKQIRLFFESIISDGYSMIVLSDIGKYNILFEIGIRQAGFIRPIAQHLCPLSLIVDLKQPFSFHRNWKRNVKKSIETGNEFEVVESPTIEDAKIFVELFNQLKDRKNLRFSITAEQIIILLRANYKLFFINHKGSRIAGRIEYIHNGSVYDIYAANSYKAIESGAAYHIQDGILHYFSSKGSISFDYGRISPSADYMNDIYVSKSYSGGSPILYNGEWFYSKSLLVSYLYSFYLHVIHKQRIY